MTTMLPRADYLVIGAGAMGMAFTDVLLTETDATVVLVDRRARPAGHWNDAYPFVRLHQPSSFYGVNSRKLGRDTKDATGWNQGLYELASGPEVVAYFDQVLHEQFLPSGRVRFFPMCSYEGDRAFRSLVSGEAFEVAATKVVDATYMNVTVPATHPPRYEVAAGVRCLPLNDLVRVTEPPDRYVVIGAGKTGIDACLWLLATGVDPDAIRWIMPRDSWLMDRAKIQPGPEFLETAVATMADQLEVAASAASIEELFDGLESNGSLLRLDPDVRPTMYRCATVTVAELDQLRRIGDVVRLGRVRRIDPTEIALDGGVIQTTPNTLHVDCTSDGLQRRPVVPVFAGDLITLQAVRTCQQVFSAAFTAHVEASYTSETEKNELCTVVPHPNTDVDWLRATIVNSTNPLRWRQDPELRAWLTEARLDGFSRSRSEIGANPALGPILGRVGNATPGALANLQRLVADLDATSR